MNVEDQITSSNWFSIDKSIKIIMLITECEKIIEIEITNTNITICLIDEETTTLTT